MKYMILLYDNADIREIFSSRSDLMEEMDGLLEEIRQSGELVATEPLADPVQTKTVRPADGPPVVTDGPLAEAKEHFGGYLIVDCETNERAVEIAAEWPSARFAPIEVRPILDVGGAEPLRPTTTSTSCGRWRRRCSPCSCAATARSTRPSTRSERHSSQRLGSGRRRVFPSTRVRGSSRPLPAEMQQDRRLTTSHRVPAVRGHLLELAGDSAAAAEA